MTTPLIIAGPCSVESESQLLTIARSVKAAGAQMLRGGAFKSRTSPHSFQGLGEEGLKLLAQARDDTGLPIVTEVVDTQDVPLVAEYADMLQVGSRNAQNFALLKALGKTQRPVLLKRGMAMTIDEWLHSADYILSGGNSQVTLCERGIRSFETSTRYTLDLNAIPVLKERTKLPIIVDPSHGTGVARYVPAMSRAALAAGADGLLIEVHCTPETAWSDGQQSMTCEAFAALMSTLSKPLRLGSVIN